MWHNKSLPQLPPSPKHELNCPTIQEDQMCYCILVKVTMGDGRGDQPLHTHGWSGSLITDILQEACLKDQILEAMVLSHREAILFFGRNSQNEGLPYQRAKDIKFCLGGECNWAGKVALMEVSVKMVQEGCHAIVNVITEDKTRARGAQKTLRKYKIHLDPYYCLWCQEVDVRHRSSLQCRTKAKQRWRTWIWMAEHTSLVWC